MESTIVTSKYRITIPKKIREALGLRKGQIVEITVSGNHITVQPLGDEPHDRAEQQSDS